jgi:NADPH:quinone reductase
MLAPGGRVVVVGSRGDVQITPRDIMTREAAVLGVFLWGVPPRQGAEIHAALQAGLSSGVLRPIVGLELPLADASQAHRRLAEPGRLGKLVLVP